MPRRWISIETGKRLLIGAVVAGFSLLVAVVLLESWALSDADQKYQQARDHPRVSMWNECGPASCVVAPGPPRVAVVPDTFDLELSYTSTVPVSVVFMTLEGYRQFGNCGYSLSCVNPAELEVVLPPARSVHGTSFKLAEGCAAYVMVFQASNRGTLAPDIHLTYHPSSQPTGACFRATVGGRQ